MTGKLIFGALCWGAAGGFLALQAAANLLAAGFCLHGLLMTRWKRLRRKGAAGAVKYSVNLRLLGKVAGYALLFFLLWQWGDAFARQQFRFTYHGPTILWAGAAALLVSGLSARATWRRLADIWKMSHRVDYAERRQRTRMLKS